MRIRIVLDILFFLSVLILPWWISGLFALFLIFYMKSFYEAVLAGFMLDTLYGTPTQAFFGLQFILTVSSLALVIAVSNLKKILWYYSVT